MAMLMLPSTLHPRANVAYAKHLVTISMETGRLHPQRATASLIGQVTPAPTLDARHCTGTQQGRVPTRRTKKEASHPVASCQDKRLRTGRQQGQSVRRCISIIS